MKCPNCDSNKLIPYAQIIDKGDASALKLAVREAPDAAIFKGWHLFDVVSTLCCDCGRMTFTALGNLTEAWEAFEKSGKEVAMPDAKVIDAKTKEVLS